MIGFVTDSSSQLPAALAARFGIEVAPVRVTVDGREYSEGVDLDADGFYALWGDPTRSGLAPHISTSAPTPGDIAAAYDRAIARGASEILSIHVGSAYSGTCNSARIAATTVDVPVRVVDSATLSFGISCCIWEAAEAVMAGAGIEAAAEVAMAVSATVESTTVLRALEVTRAGGRLAGRLPDQVDGVPVIHISGAGTDVVGEGRTVNELADLLVAPILAAPAPCRVAVCIADASARPLQDAMEARLVGSEVVADLVRYRVGPSIGAHTGPGTAGGFWYPRITQP